jgi:bifunctional DNA-binding transcriptional regulator/antitoxin component of YhaV-PrlF toxin-antitoxin module
MVKVQKSKIGRYTISIPVYIAEAMGLEKGSKVKFRWNGGSWELRKE